MKVITSDIESILVTPEQIDELTTRIAKQISEDYKDSKKKLVLVCILKGSLMFTSELMKKLELPVEIEFMKVSSYGAGTKSSGEIKVSLDLNRDDLQDIDLLVVEDIVDSGRTLSRLTTLLLLLIRQSAPFDTYIFREFFSCNLFENFHSLARAVTRCRLSCDGRCVIHIEPFDASGTCKHFRFTPR